MAAHLTFQERDEFKRRLRMALRDAGINPNRPSELLRAFVQSDQGATVTLSSVFKWLQGEALPASNNMEIVAKICNVCPVWLRTGQSPAEPTKVDADVLTLRTKEESPNQWIRLAP